MNTSPSHDAALRARITRTPTEAIEGYLADTRLLDYRAVCSTQRPPWPSIACGAAGVAYALWRARSGWPETLERADALLSGAEVAPSEDYQFEGSSHPRGYRSSLYYGPLGVSLVQALVADARSDARRRAKALAAFLSGVYAVGDDEEELLQGDAGLLNGIRILHDATRLPALRSVGDAIAERLIRTAAGEARPGTSFARPGFGHGTAGILHALLAWSEHTGSSLSPDLNAALWRFMERQDRESRESTGAEDWLRRSWCNGVSGRVLLWVKAYEVTRDETFRVRAEADGVDALMGVAGSPLDLCCGLGGRAYACLALDRIDPERGWGDRARKLALRTAVLQGSTPGSWRHGLFKGHPGFVCLALDLASPASERKGFPLVEF